MSPESNETLEVKTEVPQNDTVATSTEEYQQQNWKKFREQRELERKQKEEAEKIAREKEKEAAALKAAMETILNKQSPNHDDQNSNQNEMTEDQRIQIKVDQALAVRERQYEAERNKREAESLPQKLSSTHRDFNQVCTPENLDYLEYHYPEIARAFRNAPDNFEKWSDIYSAIKRFVPNSQSSQDEKKIEKNLSKPKSMVVPGTTQTGDSAPIMIDEKRKAENWARMQRVRKTV
jgi:hypothetical protein